LGEGLTSIVIRSAQPLLLVEDTERKTRELGARVVGKPALSWLGVPMLMRSMGAASADDLSPGPHPHPHAPLRAGASEEEKIEVVGVLIVQDVNHEGRFTEDDQRLLTTLASQLAVVVRNTRLIETTRHFAEQERRINEITARIRRQVEIEAILKTTAHEIGQALGARQLKIELAAEKETRRA
jgi:GAF domain-containing protein